MEYQKKANLLDGVSSQSSKFRAKNWTEINDEECILLVGIID